MVSRDNEGVFNQIRPNKLHRDPDDQTGFQLTVRAADPDYIELMQMKLIAGSLFQDMTTIERIRRDTVIRGQTLSYVTLADMNTYVLLNRAAVDYLGMTPEEAIGKRVIAQIDAAISPNPIICGVIENFHFESLHRPIGGYCIHYGTGAAKMYVVVRLAEGKLSEQVKSVEDVLMKLNPAATFVPEFLDQKVADFYINERRAARISIIFSILAIFVACMGVFGLTAFMAEQRVKEIGVRKVMGASTWNIVSLFTSDYLKLLGISLLIAIPVAWWVGHRYLENFSYRISLSWWMFVAAALLIAVLTLLTVSFLAIKAAMTNPVQNIKVE
jgi:ABC-type antimicrobial peptide transport system permease subunit